VATSSLSYSATEVKPTDGWRKVGRIDTALDADPGPAYCEACGHRARHFVILEHNDYEGQLFVGGCCARRLKLRWRIAASGNLWIEVRGHILIVVADRFAPGRWVYSIDRVFCRRNFPSVEAAKAAGLEAI
jgi:hypothetical protein